jgi:UDP-sugar pyrophosphorylase
MPACAFVLVAGGLGERLGYSGIKVALPVETTTGACFLDHYISMVTQLYRRAVATQAGEGRTGAPLAPPPFVIMTSDDTHDRTLSLLAAHSNFGLLAEQVCVRVAIVAVAVAVAVFVVIVCMLVCTSGVRFWVCS